MISLTYIVYFCLQLKKIRKVFFNSIVNFQIKLFTMFLLYHLSVVESRGILHLLAVFLPMKPDE